MKVFAQRLSSFEGDVKVISSIATPFGELAVETFDFEGTVAARYCYRRNLVLLGERSLPLSLARGCVAHEVGHAHHQWHWSTKYSRTSWERVWQGLVDQGLLNGYAAKNCREGWAELYRLNLGCAFDPKEGGTVGAWQYSPEKAKAALQAWRGIL